MFKIPSSHQEPPQYVENAKNRCNQKIKEAVIEYVREVYDTASQQSKGQDSRPATIETLIALREKGRKGLIPAQLICKEAGFPENSTVVRRGLKVWVSAGIVEEKTLRPSIGQVTRSTYGFRISDDFYEAVKEAIL